MNEEYRVQLDVFSGPLDLLLYLIRRDELDIQDIPIARVTEQYLDYVRMLESIDPNVAGDFLVLASTLVELKSRALLPTPPIEALEDADDPRSQLVRQLLEYKRFKDAADALRESADERRRRFARRPADLPAELQGLDLEDVEVWDLVRAFGKVMTAIGQGPGVHRVRLTEAPLAWFCDRILERLERGGAQMLDDLLVDREDRGEVIGLFLALLELVRQRRVVAKQERLFGAIYLLLAPPEEALGAVDQAGETDAPPGSDVLAPASEPSVLQSAAADEAGLVAPRMAGLDAGPWRQTAPADRSLAASRGSDPPADGDAP